LPSRAAARACANSARTSGRPPLWRRGRPYLWTPVAHSGLDIPVRDGSRAYPPPLPSCGPERACRPPGCSPWPSRSPPKTHCFEPPPAGGAVTLAAARKVGSTGDVPAALTACAAADHLRARRIVVSRADRFLAEERSGCPTPSGVTLAHADLLPALFG